MDQFDIIRLRHMRDAAAEPLQFASGRVWNDLDIDRTLIVALIKDLEAIAEAAN